MFVNDEVVAIAGDWHGETSWAFKAVKAAHDAGIKTIFQLGDFGIFGGSGEKYRRKLDMLCGRLGVTIVVVDGNHEDHVRIANLPVREDGLRIFAPRILIAPRGWRWTINNTTFVALGGANSIDREWRTPNVSWWEQEQISMGDVYRTIEGGYADVMLAHDCPEGVNIPMNHRDSDWTKQGIAYANQSRATMRAAVDGVRPSMFFHGHYHVYYDKFVTLGNFTTGDVYKTRYIGLDMNGSDEHNMVFLNTVTKEVSDFLIYYVKQKNTN